MPSPSDLSLYYVVVYGGIVCSFLFLSILLSFVSVLRESQQLMVIALVVFGILLCALVAGMTWTHESQDEVKASYLDVYDGLYDQVVRGTFEGHRTHLMSIHEKFQCCGKISWPQTFGVNNLLCKNMTESQDCVLVISAALNTHWNYVKIVLLLSLLITVYGMILSSFLYISFPRCTTWGRRGEYSLTNGFSGSRVLFPTTALTHLLPHQFTK
ncbi:tetraspanin-32 [Pelobates cultripes]|uniref:Tetraspanin-32 n=1 Tax=Pelobates cultripes TaxID=61616 RepID=A0AAD1THL6_PELCU|nr:tetraspanin-32 [Pelobates cultripes]CAH2326294.1 tetraspanin-32 [Pelobates cultripes]